MNWPARITLGILGVVLLSVSYLCIRHYTREDNSISTSIHLEPVVRNSPNFPTVHSGVDQLPQERKSLSATIPFGRSNPNSGDLSNATAAERTVRVALQMIEEGDYKKARDLLLTRIMATPRGSNYLRYGKPDRVSMRKEITLTGKDQVQFENWVYENGRGRISRELEFMANPADRQTEEQGASELWALGYSFYSEGGVENEKKGKNIFEDFLVIFANGPEDLVQAAQIDIAVIDIKLMHSASTLGYRIAAASEAVEVLKKFILKWPNHPRANDAGISLKIAQEFLLNPR